MTLIAFFLGFACCAVLVSHSLGVKARGPQVDPRFEAMRLHPTASLIVNDADHELHEALQPDSKCESSSEPDCK